MIKDFQKGKNEFWIVFAEQADVSAAKNLRTKEEKGQFVYEKLTETAARVQSPFIALLNSKGAKYQSFWICNAIFIEGNRELAEELAIYPEIKELLPNPRMRMIEPVEMSYEDVAKKDNTLSAIEWGINKVKAPQVWAMGFKGQNVVVGGQDTGYEYDVLSLETQYRGYTGSTPVHDYNWHDAIHSGGGGSCGVNSPFPCDDHNHGTHTMGTIVGDDGMGNQIGMAPLAKWIGARNMNQGVGSPVTYNECWQWFLAPTKVNGQNPDPSKAPHVINNSWGCDASEGCNSSNWSTMETAINNLRAAGIVVVVSAGNDGPQCNTVNGPPAHYAGSFTVGSTTSSDAISTFSSRGNVNIDGSGRIKPNVVAPGSNIRSCIRNGGFATYSGTSMAGPHVAGAVALLISAVPWLSGQVDSIEAILERTAVHITSSQTCNGTPPSTFPNNTVGYGRIDVLAAVTYALSVTGQGSTPQNLSGITVFPTLVTESFYIRFENAKDTHAEIKLYNSTGQLVRQFSESVHHDTHEILINDLHPGVYMYYVQTNSGFYFGKIVKA